MTTPKTNHLTRDPSTGHIYLDGTKLIITEDWQVTQDAYGIFLAKLEVYVDGPAEDLPSPVSVQNMRLDANSEASRISAELFARASNTKGNNSGACCRVNHLAGKLKNLFLAHSRKRH